ncbi:MAG: hypothetical protein AMXMBFR57_07180 [Acidimicrobiia bacterium]
MTTARRHAVVELMHSTPRYELRVRRRGAGDLLLEVWQLPALATPEVKEAKYVGGLGGRNLALIEHRLLRQLKAAHIDVTKARTGDRLRFAVSEIWALRLGLIFRLLAPMRHRGYIRACVEGIEAMPGEEAAYWLGMAMHRKYPRRVLKALRCLLVDPRYFS